MIRKVTLVGLGLAALTAACEVRMGTDAKSPQNPAPASAPPPAAAPAQPGAQPTPTATPGQPAPASPARATSVGSVARGSKINLDKPLPLPTPSGGGTTLSKPIDFGSATASPDAWRGTVYFIPEKVQKFPDVSTLQPAATLYTNELNITPRRFETGFPGVNDKSEWFAIRYEAPLEVATEADYEFRLVSDDGALFHIDGTLIIDNDGLHTATEKKQLVHLVKGTHSMRIDYFQGARGDVALQLFVKAPNAAERAATTKL
jgi:hypothetical protein